MHYIQAAPTVLTVLALAYMGFLVSRNSRDRTNQLFLLFVLADAFWLMSVFLINNTNLGANVLAGRLVFAFAALLIMGIQGFTNSLLKTLDSPAYRLFFYTYGALLVPTTITTSLIIQGVQTNPDSAGNLSPFPVYGVLWPLFLVFLAINVITLLFVFIGLGWSLRKKEGSKKQQLYIVASGLFAFTVVSTLTNLVLPEIFSAPWPSQFAPLGSLILTASFFYAMGRYRLFDIRSAVVRSTTYIFLVIGLALVYVAGASLATALNVVGATEDLFNIVIVLGIAVSFQPLKRLFDKATNKFFFRDLYDTQEVVDKLNGILISSFDLDRLTQRCEQLLTDTLKLEFCALIVLVQNDGHKVVGLSKDFMDHHEYVAVKEAFGKTGQKIISRPRNLEQADKEIQKFFGAKRISAIARMASGNDTIGLIVFGSKKNDKELSRQDLGVLSITADQVAIATQNVMRFEEIQKFNATLQKEVDDATRELRKTNDRLRVLDQTKDDFISMASHQLRTPLTSVKGYLSMVLEGDAGKLSGKQDKLLNQAFISSERMVYLIADLLNVSRLKTGKFVIEQSPVNLAYIITGEVGQLIETATARGLKLTYKKPDTFPTLMLDETKIRQVIMNFIDNAIYYTPSGGHIQVALSETPQSITFSVADDGIGVPKAEQHHLFNKFYRAGNARKARPDGTGLGLFMAKKVIIAQGGSIIFRSQEGKGSTFGFTFAKAKLQPPKEHTKPEK